jgi:hypothetical protein
MQPDDFPAKAAHKPLPEGLQAFTKPYWPPSPGNDGNVCAEMTVRCITIGLDIHTQPNEVGYCKFFGKGTTVSHCVKCGTAVNWTKRKPVGQKKIGVGWFSLSGQVSAIKGKGANGFYPWPLRIQWQPLLSCLLFRQPIPAGIVAGLYPFLGVYTRTFGCLHPHFWVCLFCTCVIFYLTYVGEGHLPVGWAVFRRQFITMGETMSIEYRTLYVA